MERATKKELRDNLKSAYDSFVQKWGHLNSKYNRRLILQDEMGFTICSSLEVKTGTDYIPADILTRDLDEESEPFRTDSAAEALSHVLGHWGRCDIDEIARILDRDEEEVIMELGNLIYYDITTDEWLVADKLLSGDIYRKIVETEKQLEELKKEDT